MKKNYIFTGFMLIFWGHLFAQTPQFINYQGVARDSSGKVISNKSISLKLSIVSDSVLGNTVYSETHSKTTDFYGLFSLQIGKGNIVSGLFNSISWGSNSHYLQVEIDQTGGINYQIAGTSQFAAVPYAMYATSSGGSAPGNNPGDMLFWNGSEWIIVPAGSHGQKLSFCNGVPTWGGCLPLLTTTIAISILATTVTSGGNVSNDGGALVTTRGICYSTSPLPTISNNIITSGSDTGSFIANLSGLSSGTTYYVRAYATNSNGTAYGNQITITTISLPTITTVVTTSITSTTATSGGDITDSGGDSITVRGICFDTIPNPTTAKTTITSGSGNGIFTTNIIGLLPVKTYYIRAYAINSVGTAYGNEVSFTTHANLPSLLDSTTLIASFSASVKTNIISDGGSNITAKGVCWSTLPNPTISLLTKTNDGNGNNSFYRSITGLNAGITYYVRAYATNSEGTAYSNELNFITKTDTIVDNRDGNIYSYVKIGNQYWMAENLKYMPYIVPMNWVGDIYVYDCINYNVADAIQTENYKQYGVLYKPDRAQSVCPTGWKLPRWDDYLTLQSFIGSDGGKLKEAGLTHWNSPNTGATDDYGFCARGGGARINSGSSQYLREGTSFWTSTNLYQAGIRYYKFDLSYNSSYGGGYHQSASWCYSVRCLKRNLATISTNSISNIQQTTANSGGNISNDGGLTITAKGVCWGLSPNPTIVDSITIDGSGSGSFSSNLAGLTQGTTYYVRAYATNSDGTAYGNEVSFITISLPILTTNAIDSIAKSSAVSGGIITHEGGASITERGVCWSTSSNPTIADSKTTDGTGISSYTSNLTGLTPNTLYYVRAYATNSAGTAYGNEVSFTTLQNVITTVTDYDGNVYDTVVISTQVWMKQNLKVTHYRNGDAIPNITENAVWFSLNSGAYCNYNNDTNIANIYGRLYNGYSVIDNRNLCPINWHVATDNDWNLLVNYLGGNNIAGGKLKEVGTIHWSSPNIGATNESGFTILPSGNRDIISSFNQITYGFFFWTSTIINSSSLSERNGGYDSGMVLNCCNGDIWEGYAVRCIKD